MERISQYAEDHPGLSGTALRKAVSGNSDAKKLALELLINEGWMTFTQKGQSKLHYSAKPFRAAT
jgi:hypothetical protein